MAQYVDEAILLLRAEDKGIQDATVRLDLMKNSLELLEQQFKTGQVSFAKYVQQGGEMAAQVKQISGALDTAIAAVNKYGTYVDATNQLQKQASVATKQYGQGMMQLAYIFDDVRASGGDFTRMLMYTANNIPGLLMGLGMEAGLAGKISILGSVATVVLPPLIAQLDAMGAFGPKIHDAGQDVKYFTDQLKMLEDKPFKVALDYKMIDEAKKRLDELQSGLREYEAGQKGKSVPEMEAGQAITEEMARHGDQWKIAEQKIKDARVKELAEANQDLYSLGQRIQRFSNQIAEHQKALASPDIGFAERHFHQTQIMGKEFGIGLLRGRFQEVSKEIEQQARSEVGILIEETKKGNKPGHRQMLAGWLREVGEEQKALLVEMMTPEEMAAQNRAAQDAQRQQDMARLNKELRQKQDKAAKDADRKAKDANNKLIQALERQGQENETPALKEANALAAERKRQQTEAQRRQQRQTKAAADALSQGGYENFAEQLLARHLGRGGRLTDEGKLPEAQHAEFTAAIERAIRQQNRGMSPRLAHAAAGELANRAESGLQAKMLAVSGRTNNDMSRMGAVAGWLMNGMQQLESQAARNTMMVDALERQAGAMQRNRIPRGR